jgi:O-antigen/teichoic acid export membrane protein
MSLAGKAARGTFWVAGGAYATQLVNFGTNIVLMRLLAPEHFGVLALAMVFLTLAQKIFGFGFNHALIHRQDDLETAARVHQLLHLLTGAIVVGLIAAAAPLLKIRYEDLPAAVLLVLAVGALGQGLGHTSRIMLEKELRFGRVTRANLAGVFASDVTGIVLAIYGLGIWALIIRQLVAWLVPMIGYVLAAGRGVRIVWDWPLIRWYFRFGAFLWIGGIATLITLKFDDFLVGTLIDSTTLGYYARAYALATMPTVMVTHVIGRVAFPLYSKLQNDRDRLSDAFSATLRLILVFTLPLGVGLAILAPEFVRIVYGDKWNPMIVLIRLLLIYAVLRPIFDNTGELFTAVGKPKIAGTILAAQAIAVFLFCPVMTWNWGAEGAAVAVGLVLLTGVVLAYRTLPGYVNISFAETFLPPVFAALVGAGASWVVSVYAPMDSDVISFILKGSVFTLGFVLALAIVNGRKYLEDARRFKRAMSA